MPIDFSRVDESLMNPDFVKDIKDVFGPSQWNWLVTEGFRSIERSNTLFAAYKAGTGPRAAPGGSSAHNFGLAVDVVFDGDPVKAGVQPDWNTSKDAWQWLLKTIKAHPRLSSGAGYHDWPHVERYQWRKFKNWSKSTGGSAQV